MALHAELQEAVDGVSSFELAAFLSKLPVSLADVVHTGFFDEEQLVTAFETIFLDAGLSEEHWEDIERAIDEFVDGLDADVIEEGFFSDVLKSAAKGALKGAAGHAATALAKSAKGQKGTLKHTLKHAAAGAIKQIAKDPSKAKEIAKKSVGKLAGKAAAKGMKMVFGRWVEIGKKGAKPKSGGGEDHAKTKATPKAEPKGQAMTGTHPGAAKPLKPGTKPPKGHKMFCDPTGERCYSYLAKESFEHDAAALEEAITK